MDSSCDSTVLPQGRPGRGNGMMRRARYGQPLTVCGTADYVRDYLFVEDAARAFLLAAEPMEALHGGYFVIGTGTGSTIKQALQTVADCVTARIGTPVAVQPVDPPARLAPIERRNFVADPKLFRSRNGWQAEASLSEGIDRTIANNAH